MTFILESLGVLSAGYWISAVAGEVVLGREAGGRLPAATRAAVGVMLVVTYFAAAWILFTIEISWFLGLVMGILTLLGRRALPAREVRGLVAERLRDHARAYSACLVLGIVFFAPPLFSGNPGPFTEGGGDVSIYADTAKFLSDRNLTIKGRTAGGLEDAIANGRQATRWVGSRATVAAAALERQLAADRQLMNPPSAENPVYRLLVLQSVTFLVAPYAPFDFLAEPHSNYDVYFGVQALAYALTLLCLFEALLPFSRAAAWAGFLLALASHALVAVHYNMYSGQALSLLAATLVLSLLPRIKALSWTGIKAFGPSAAYIGVSYVHYLSVIGPPMLLGAALGVKAASGGATPALEEPPGTARLAARWGARTLAVLLGGLLLAAGFGKSMLFLRELFIGHLSGGVNVYLGEKLAVPSRDWLAFVVGLISQQHIAPLVKEPTWLGLDLAIGIAFAGAAFALGIALFARAAIRAPLLDPGRRYCLLLYATLVIVVTMHMYAANSYIYMQAKGAQNVLPFIYAVMVLPLALVQSRDRVGRLMSFALAACLLALFVALLVLRLEFGRRIAYESDRSTIVEASYFAAASRVRAADPHAFVLFVPRKSGDLYLTDEPFFGMRVVPTRYLALTELVFHLDGVTSKRVDASHFIRPTDWPHLWTIGATAGSEPKWRAERVFDGTRPVVYLAADGYERRRVRSSEAPGGVRTLSEIRRGSAMLYLPAGAGGELTVYLAPADGRHRAKLRDEIEARIREGQFDPAFQLNDSGASAIVLRAHLDRAPGARLLTIARGEGSFLLGATLDSEDLPVKDESAELVATGRVFGRIEHVADGGLTVHAGWTGLRPSAQDDWIGVFPADGDDASRIAFAFLGGGAQGEVDLALPPGSGEGPYDVRLYAAGSWNVVSQVRIGSASGEGSQQR